MELRKERRCQGVSGAWGGGLNPYYGETELAGELEQTLAAS